MSVQTEISLRAFFEASEKPTAFGQMLYECLRRKQGFCATLRQDRVVLSLREVQAKSTELRLSGSWRAPEFRGVPAESTAARLFLPFLFCASEVMLPPGQIATMGHAYRSVADFFMRNLFSGLSSGSPVLCQQTGAGQGMGPVRDLQRQYVYLFKSLFPEPELNARDAQESMEYILANAYVPLLTFDNPLLSQGAEHLRRISASPAPVHKAATLKAEMMQVRGKMLEHFGG